MISFLKGTAYSLLQSDWRGNLATSGSIVEGSVVRLDPSTGNCLLGSSVATELPGTADLLGLALNSDVSGDVIESGKIGAIALDGQSVIQTDQVSGTISAANYPIGTTLTVTSAGVWTTGTVGTHKICGVVDGPGAVSFPGVATTVASSGYNSVPNGTAVASQNIGVQAPIQVLTIKLLSA
jgi:hypothetical protein